MNSEFAGLRPKLTWQASEGGDGGEAGIRTLGRSLSPYNGLANRRLRPLGHLTAAPSIRKIRTCVDVSIRRATVFRSATCADLARIRNPPECRSALTSSR